MRALLIGRFLGEKTLKDGTLQRWLVTRLNDGNYFIQFKTKKIDGADDSWSEVGIWGVRAPIYFTAMRGHVNNQRISPSDHTNPDRLY